VFGFAELSTFSCSCSFLGVSCTVMGVAVLMGEWLTTKLRGLETLKNRKKNFCIIIAVKENDFTYMLIGWHFKRIDQT